MLVYANVEEVQRRGAAGELCERGLDRTRADTDAAVGQLQ
jgi:hypothetical protein